MRFKNCCAGLFFCVFVLPGLSFLSCGSHEKVKVGYYVTAPDVAYEPDFPPSSLYIEFDGSVSPVDMADREIDLSGENAGKIEISPRIGGKWRWSSDSELVFSPSEAWLLDTTYKVRLRDDIFSDSVSVKNDFSFRTEGLSVVLCDPDFYINPENPEEKRVTATVRASHPLERENFEKFISMEMKVRGEKGPSVSKKMNFTVSWSKDSTEAYLVSDIVPVPPRTSDFTIKMASGIPSTFKVRSGSSDSGSRTLEIPGMSDFVRVLQISHSLIKNESQNYDQILSIETKGSVSSGELLSHMEAFILPADKPEEQGWKAVRSYNWEYGGESDFTDLVRSLSTKIEMTAVPSAEPAGTLNNFVFKAPESAYIFVRLSGTINFFGGYKLYTDEKRPHAFLKVKNYPTELEILSEGTILSLSGSRKMALLSRGVSKVRYTLARIMPRDVNHLVSMSNGDMKNFRFDTGRFDENNISEKEISYYDVPSWSKEFVSYLSFDFSRYLSSNSGGGLANGLFVFEAADCSKDYKTVSDKRLILVTDLGFIVKQNQDGSKEVFVQSVSNGNPVPNAQVQILGLNGNPIASTYTDSSGHASLPRTASDDYYGEHAPTAYIVRTSRDLSFMPYSERGRTLDYSNYDVGGEYGSDSPSKINAYMFSDRGMYRPGDTVHVGLIAKSGDWSIDLRNLPLECEVKDPQSSVVHTSQFQLSASGFEEIAFSTKDYSPTGMYNVNLYILKEKKGRIEREYLSSTTVRIEEFLPDTLRLSTAFEPAPSEGWINPRLLKGKVSLKNLFGTPAEGNDVKAQMTLRSGFPPLKKYSDYHFSDPFYKSAVYEQFLGTVRTDGEGEASFDLDIGKFEKATYRLEFYVEGYEKEGGRSVSQMSSLYVSPLRYLVGYKSDGPLSYINRASVRAVSLIAVDQNLGRIDLDDITASIEEIKYVSTLVRQPNGLFKYQSVKKSCPVSSEKIRISRDGTDFMLPSEISGEYKLTLTDSQGLVYNTINYTIVGEENVSRSLTRTAELELKLEKSDFFSGESARIFVKAPYAGFGLITVEKDKVYSWKWFRTDELSSVQTIQIPREIEGNAYINVMFMRSPRSQEIFMSPFCYGAVPFTLDKSARTNDISLEVPDEIKSGEDLRITYSSGRDGKIVIFAVDEGILQVAKYNVPDPLGFFFRKRALEVRTSQIMDLVLPEFEILRTMSAMGGGADMDELSRNLNPFKRKQNAPVAFWSGIIETGKERRSVTYRIPDYFNGAVRVMAVAVSADSVGVGQASLVARSPFVISPNAPLAASPDDEFDVSVSVTNAKKGSGKNHKISLTATASPHLEILGEKTMSLAIDEGKDETVTLRARAKNLLGGAEILFTASDASDSSSLSHTMSVRPAMPYQVWIESGKTDKSSVSVDVGHKIYDDHARRELAVSNVPEAFLDGLNFYLANYPYGCSEQITSQAYPYLFDDFLEAHGKTKADAREMVSGTIGILQSRMLGDGNIGYWTNKSSPMSEITLYCAEFLTDARKRGFFVPSAFFDKVMGAVRTIANSSKDSEFDIRQRARAIYVLTKNEIVTTSYIEKLEGDLSRKNYSETGYEGLYLAASYAMLRQDKKAGQILSKIKRKMFFDSSWLFHNGLHYAATYIDIVASYFPERMSELKSAQIDLLCENLKDEYYNTYSVCAAIRAFESYSGMEKGSVYSAAEISGKEEREVRVEGSPVLKGEFSGAAEKIIFRSSEKIPIFYQTLTAGFETQIPDKEIKDGIEVSREFTTLDGKKIDRLALGDDVLVRVSFRSLKGQLRNVAFVDMLCAGLEADIESVRSGKYNKSWRPDYVDVREDRLVIYGSAGDKVSSFTYKAKATASGSFTVPPMFAESMYNKSIRAVAPQKKLVIEKRGGR